MIDFRHTIKSEHIMQWTQQLASLLHANLPLAQALHLLTETQHHKTLQQLTHVLHDAILNGQALSCALKNYPSLFDKTYCQLVYMAEQSGTLATILQKIAAQKKFQLQLRYQIKKALIYPGMVLTVGISVFILLLVWVVPQLSRVFTQFDQALPPFTQFILRSSSFLQHMIIYFIPIALFFALFFQFIPKYSHFVANTLARWRWHLPMIGKLLQHTYCILFSRTLALLLTSGIPIATALPTVIPLFDNRYAQQQIKMAELLIQQGHSLSYALQQTRIFPVLAVHMWHIGEHSGKLSSLLQDCADYYQQQLDAFIQQMLQFLEPVLLIVLGLLIGSVVIAMYLPLFKLGLVMGG